MRIMLNDYSGHPFQVELGRELARRGNDVLHLYSADFQTPKGDLVRKSDDPELFSIKGVTLGEPFKKYNFVRRRKQEIRYSRLIIEEIKSFKPDIFIGTNNPLDAQLRIQNFCRSNAIPFVFWLQDIYSIAITSILSEKIPVLGRMIGLFYEFLERTMLRRSQQIIAITEDFGPLLASWGVAADRVAVIENWAPKDKIKVGDHKNAWRETQGLGDAKVVLYTGTLGLKHNPDLILDAARKFVRDRPEVKIVVTSEGPQTEYVRATASKENLSNLIVLPFQPFDIYSDVLAAADILIALIEPDAASYSVPSKVLSYHCSGRPIVLSADAKNLAAKIILRANSGLVTQPHDHAGFVAAIETLLYDEVFRKEAGVNARAYADENFDVVAIADKFEKLLRQRVERR